MGRYFGIKNYTRNQGISSYWKGAPPSVEELEEISKTMDWNLETDFVVSHCYDSGYRYDCKTKDWEDDSEVNPPVKPPTFDEPMKIYSPDGKMTKDTTFFCN